jgi:hypothetical protein
MNQSTKGDMQLELAIQGTIWLGAGATLIILLSRRRKRQLTR